ncbi:Cell division protein ZipA [hydrothermal vent metagenome]|uniref:Cell division protein ZipA n=1 Tax=hydrothermal vent metagenome TaxID=652676 RepID=A0A3B0XHV9_9ZZZZ
MNNLRWILLGVAAVIIVAIYFFGRARKRDQSYASICAASEITPFRLNEEEPELLVEEKGWSDGVGPVRVVSSYDDIDDVLTDDDTANMYVDEPEIGEPVLNNSVQNTEEVDLNNESEVYPESTSEHVPQSTPDIAIDDVISIYVLAKSDCSIKGVDILKVCRTLGLEYGDMKIFHRHDQTEVGNIIFSMASIQEPGWFEIEDMDQMETLGLSFFMQANLVDNPSEVLDDMLICAHGLASTLGATLCNSQRKILNAAFTSELRDKIKQLEVLKQSSIT